MDVKFQKLISDIKEQSDLIIKRLEEKEKEFKAKNFDLSVYKLGWDKGIVQANETIIEKLKTYSKENIDKTE